MLEGGTFQTMVIHDDAPVLFIDMHIGRGDMWLCQFHRQIMGDPIPAGLSGGNQLGHAFLADFWSSRGKKRLFNL